MSTHVPDYWPVFEAYHDVREPVYRTIIADVRLASDAVILDAACGDAYYSGLLIDVLGPRARIVAVDRNPALLQSRPRQDRAIEFCQSDVERAGLRRSVFDAIWLCRAMHSAFDPLWRLASLAPLLQSGGKLIVVENDLAHCPILSWPADFESRVQQALRRHLQSQCPDGASIERYYAARHLPAWLERVGLQRITVRTYPVEDLAPMPGDVETYWKLAMDFQGKLMWPFLSPEDRQTYARAFDPDSPDYLLNRPGFFCLEPITVACGTAP